MKLFEEFTLLEHAKELSNTDRGSVIQYSAHDVDKLNVYGRFNEKELQMYILMKLRRGLFCTVNKMSDNRVILEQLDTKKFNIDIELDVKKLGEISIKAKENRFNDHDTFIFYKSTSDFMYKFYRISGLANIEDMVDFYTEEIVDVIKNYRTLHQYFDKCYEIIKYFKDNNFLKYENGFKTDIDLHTGNFGYKKGTHELRCFDPLFIRSN